MNSAQSACWSCSTGGECFVQGCLHTPFVDNCVGSSLASSLSLTQKRGSHAAFALEKTPHTGVSALRASGKIGDKSLVWNYLHPKNP